MGWSIDPTPAAASAVRQEARTVLSGWGVESGLVDDVLLVINELVANAVDHARTPLRVALRRTADGVLVSVSDTSDRQPRLQPRDVRASRGRGLQLVDALAARWDSTPVVPGPGKTVWAEIRPTRPT